MAMIFQIKDKRSDCTTVQFYCIILVILSRVCILMSILWCLVQGDFKIFTI
jgi:hypothetical protein